METTVATTVETTVATTVETTVQYQEENHGGETQRRNTAEKHSGGHSGGHSGELQQRLYLTVRNSHPSP